MFTSEVGDYAGQYVKTADKALCDEIKANGRLVSKDSYTHRWGWGILFRRVCCSVGKVVQPDAAQLKPHVSHRSGLVL